MTVRDLFKIIFDTEIEDVSDYEELYSPFWNKKLTAEDIDAMSKRVRDYTRENNDTNN